MDADTLVTLARVAERAERYDEMANYMKMRVQMGSILNPEERDMFSAAFKNSLTERRVAVRVADGVEQMETAEGRDAHASLARGYRSKVEAELQSICEDALALLRSNLVPNAEAGEAKTFYLKMQGDYYRYLAEWNRNESKMAIAEEASNAYQESLQEAAVLPAAHPVRLGLALNFSVFQHEVLRQTDRAILTATEALSMASDSVNDIPEESRNDSLITMHLLSDNLNLWLDGRNSRGVGLDDDTVNQGDRLQLFRQILLPAGDRMHGIEALMMKDEDRGKLRPVDRRCRNLWDKLIAPLLTLSILGRLENRQPDLLKYLLHCLLGQRGMVYGVLASASPSKRTGTLPTWETIAKVITESDSLESRVEVLRSLGFRGPKPRKSCWSGSVWVRDEYPRNPDSAPWEGFQYVDREDADVLGQGPPGMKHEAFRMNRMWCLERSEQFDEKEQEWESGFNKRADAFIWEESPGFKWSGGAEKPITPSIYDKIQLSNRLFINEALAERVLMADRVKLVGEKLLCPLLIFSAESLKKPSIGAWIIGSDLEELEQAEKLALKRDLLRYVAAQISSSAEALSQTGIGKKAANSKEGPAWQAPFQKVFDETKEKLALALMQKAPEELETLTEKAEELRWEPGPEVRRGRVGLEANEAPEDQAELLPEDEIRWFKRRQSTQAYLQLRLCSAIGCAKDLISMAAAVSREVSSRNFAPGFWIASYGLFLWGRARQLRSGLELALRKRLIRAKWPYEDAEESESETEDDLGTEEEEEDTCNNDIAELLDPTAACIFDNHFHFGVASRVSLLTRVPPEQWKMKTGAEITVDKNRLSWLPDDWGQGLTGPGGMFRVFVSSDGHAYHDKSGVEQHVGRSLGIRDGFKGRCKLLRSQLDAVSIESLHESLSTKEKAAIPDKNDIFFAVISARRAKFDEGLQDIAMVQAQFLRAGVEPVWYVDAGDLNDYNSLGLKVVEGGRRAAARNKALEEAARLGKPCCQCSDDISRWEFRPGPRVAKSEDALKTAWNSSKAVVASPVAVAQFLLAKLRGYEGQQRAHLAGVHNNGITERTFGRDEYETHHHISGDFFVADLSPVRFDESFARKEDFVFTVQHIEKHASVLRCNRWMIEAKHRKNPGGANTNKDGRRKAEKQSQDSRWPQAFRKHKTEEREVIMTWPDQEPDSEGEAAKEPKRKPKRVREDDGQLCCWTMAQTSRSNSGAGFEEQFSDFLSFQLGEMVILSDAMCEDDEEDKEAKKPPTPLDFTKPSTPKDSAKPPTPKEGARPGTPKEVGKWLTDSYADPTYSTKQASKQRDAKPGTPKEGTETPKTRKEPGKTATPPDVSNKGAPGDQPPTKKLRAKDIQQNYMDSIITKAEKVPSTEYIAARCGAVVGQKVRDVIGTIEYTKGNGTKAVYACADLVYDVNTGFLGLEGA
eukprot:s497_g14.t4